MSEIKKYLSELEKIKNKENMNSFNSKLSRLQGYFKKIAFIINITFNSKIINFNNFKIKGLDIYFINSLINVNIMYI